MVDLLFWPIFLAVLSANLITVLVVYGLVSHQRGERMGGILVKIGRGFLTVSARAIQVFIGILLLGGLAFAFKALILGEPL